MIFFVCFFLWGGNKVHGFFFSYLVVRVIWFMVIEGLLCVSDCALSSVLMLDNRCPRKNN